MSTGYRSGPNNIGQYKTSNEHRNYYSKKAKIEKFPDVVVDMSNKISSPFIGTWSSNINCGNGFSYVSLASALPQNWGKIKNGKPDYDDFYNQNIVGNYNPQMSNGNTKYLISVGGNNATQEGWEQWLIQPAVTAQLMFDQFQERGLAGIDIDIEKFSPTLINKIIEFVDVLRQYSNQQGKYVVIQYTILLGQPEIFGPLITHNKMDYVALILYDNGNYERNSTGGGCDALGWAELFLSECACGTGNLKPSVCDPLFNGCQNYCSKIGNYMNLKGKVVLGLVIGTNDSQVADKIIKDAMDLCARYNGAGISFWLTENNIIYNQMCNQLIPEMINHNKSKLNNYFLINNCANINCSGNNVSNPTILPITSETSATSTIFPQIKYVTIPQEYSNCFCKPYTNYMSIDDMKRNCICPMKQQLEGFSKNYSNSSPIFSVVVFLTIIIIIILGIYIIYKYYDKIVEKFIP